MFCVTLQVCPKLQKHVPQLLSSPSIMLKTWAKYVWTDTITLWSHSCQQVDFTSLLRHFFFRLQPRTEALLGALVSKRVDSKEALISVWKTNEKCKDIVFFAWLKIDETFMSLISLCIFFIVPDLLSAYCQWLPEALHQEVAKRWPPV